MMPFLLAEFAGAEETLPLYVTCVGSHEQKHLYRPEGYGAHQLFLTRSGSGIFHIEGRGEVAVGPGTVLFLPYGLSHSYMPSGKDGEWDLGFIAYNGPAASSLPGPKLACLALDTPVFDSLWTQLESLWHLISLNGEHVQWEASRKLYELLLAVMESQSGGRRPGGRMYPAGQPNAALQTAVKLMHDHFGERLLLGHVARAAGYSVQHFHRLFVASYGVTPQRYLLRLRMRHAVQLMEEIPGITVESVAGQLGMETSYFIRMFKRTYGTTPRQYMKKE